MCVAAVTVAIHLDKNPFASLCPWMRLRASLCYVCKCVCSCPHKNRSLKRKPAQVTKTAPRLFADRCIVGNAGSSSSRLMDHDDVAEIFNPKMQKLHKSGRLARRCEVHKFRCCKRLLHEYFISISASLRLYSGKDSSCFFLNPFFGVISLL